MDAAGAIMNVLPAGARLHVAYTDAEVSGLNEQGITLSWLDPTSGQWAPVLTTTVDPANNVVEASIVSPGVYIVTAP